MALYKIVRRDDGNFAVQIDEGKGKPTVDRLFETEAAARAYIDRQKQIETDGERWARTEIGRMHEKE